MEASFEELLAIRHKLEQRIPLTPAEEARWEAWKQYKDGREQDPIDEQGLLDFAAYVANTDMAWLRFQKRQWGIDYPRRRIIPNRYIELNWKRAGAIAAGILLAFGTTTYFLRKLTAGLQEPIRATTTTAQLLESMAVFGKQREIILPDSTKVVLYPNARIRYPAAFNESIRKIELIGEAYFEVKKDKGKKPFLVQSGSIGIEVLGTKFNVRENQLRNCNTISLKEGAVVLHIAGSSLPMKPDEEVTVIGTGNDIRCIRQKANWKKTLAWQCSAFSFDNAPLDEIIDELERWYGVEIRYRDGQCTDRFTLPATVSRKWPIQKVLNALKSTGSIDYHYQTTNINDRPVFVVYRPERYSR